MSTSDRIWQLIARVLTGEASFLEREELTGILNQDETLHQQFDLLTRIWSEKGGQVGQEESERAHSAITRIIHKAEEEGRVIEMPATTSRWRSRKTWLVAASVLIVGCVGALFLNNVTAGNTQKKGNYLEAQNGSRSKSILPDGSTVWLNAGSKLFYENDFTGGTREVRLEGEAFFDIVKNPQRPFIVHTSGIDIKVLGTAFNVKSYPEDKTVVTTLYRGSVKVFRHDQTEKQAIQLRPNEKLILPKDARIVEGSAPRKIVSDTLLKTAPSIPTIAAIDSAKKENERLETAWVYNRLEFERDNFEELARKMERWYNIKIEFTDEKVKQLAFHGSFETETVDQAFRVLKEAIPDFNYEIKNQVVIISSK